MSTPTTSTTDQTSPPTSSALPAPTDSTVPAESANGLKADNPAATAGIAGAVIGFGAGLVVAELLIPGLILAGVGVVGWVGAKRVRRMIWRR